MTEKTNVPHYTKNKLTLGFTKKIFFLFISTLLINSFFWKGTIIRFFQNSKIFFDFQYNNELIILNINLIMIFYQNF